VTTKKSTTTTDQPEDEGRLDRVYLMEQNLDQARTAYRQWCQQWPTREPVVLILDARDTVARSILDALAGPEASRRHVNQMAEARMIPVATTAVPLDTLTGPTSPASPAMQAELRAGHPPDYTWVLTIASGGKLLVASRLDGELR
jgi:hypothetical protein